MRITKMVTLVSIFYKILLAILILSFLNIHIQRSPDTVSAIWNFIYPPAQEFMWLSLISYFGILLLVVSFMINDKFKIAFFIIGSTLLWFIVLTFYPNYWKLQREDFLNPQSLFLLSTILIISIKTYEHKHFKVDQTKLNNNTPNDESSH